MNRIQPERIDMKFLRPVKCVFDKKSANLVTSRAIKIDRLPPRSSIPVGEVWTELCQVIPFRPEMVVNHVEHHGQPARVTGFNKRLQATRPAIGILDRKRKRPIVAPIPAS